VRFKTTEKLHLLHINSEKNIEGFIIIPNMSRMVLLFVMITLLINVNHGSPLDSYVGHWDFTCTSKLLQTYPSSTYTVYIINMTSQTWLNGIITANKTIYQYNYFVYLASFSSRSIWWHYVIITVPQVLKHPDVGYLLISGGSNNDP